MIITQLVLLKLLSTLKGTKTSILMKNTKRSLFIDQVTKPMYVRVFKLRHLRPREFLLLVMDSPEQRSASTNNILSMCIILHGFNNYASRCGRLAGLSHASTKHTICEELVLSTWEREAKKSQVFMGVFSTNSSV